MNGYNNTERMIHLATIRSLENTTREINAQFEAACEINAELRVENTRNKRGKVSAEIESCELRYELVQKSEEIERLKEESRKDNRCISRLYRKSENRRDIIALLKRKISRLHNKVETWKYVAAEWENIAHAYKRESADRYAEIRSLKSQLENLRNEIATTEIPGSEICEVPFEENTNFVHGYAPCGNGCEVKKINGRFIDAHEITCEESEEYAGLWLD